MGFPSKSMKGSLENDLNYMCPAQEVSEGKNISSGLETIFVIFSGLSGEGALLFALVLKICLKLNWSVLDWCLWLGRFQDSQVFTFSWLEITFMELYNEKEQARQLEIQNVQYEEKGSVMEVSPVLKEIKGLVKSFILIE